MSPQDVSNHTGIGLTTIYNAIHTGQLRAAKVGRRYDIRWEWVTEYIEMLASL